MEATRNKNKKKASFFCFLKIEVKMDVLAIRDKVL